MSNRRWSITSVPLLMLAVASATAAASPVSPQVLDTFASHLYARFRERPVDDPQVRREIRQQIGEFVQQLGGAERPAPPVGRRKRDAFGYRAALLDSSEYKSDMCVCVCHRVKHVLFPTKHRRRANCVYDTVLACSAN